MNKPDQNPMLGTRDQQKNYISLLTGKIEEEIAFDRRQRREQKDFPPVIVGATGIAGGISEVINL